MPCCIMYHSGVRKKTLQTAQQFTPRSLSEQTTRYAGCSLPKIIDELRNDGVKLVTIPELLDIPTKYTIRQSKIPRSLRI